MAQEQRTRKMARREFLAGAAATAAFTIVKPSLVRGSAANSKVELGLIGCGGRGGWIANLFRKHGGYQIVACGDYFQDRVDGIGKTLGVEAARRYTGLSNHDKLLAGKLDAVAIESPPYFHPLQAAAAVEAGKHVFVAKPIAVDVPGCLTLGEAGRKATARKLVFVVDFQTRASAIYQEAVKRVHNGDIGRIVNGVACYYCGFMFGKDRPKDAEGRLRRWCLDQVLSGDIIVEQNIHALDVASWIMDAEPLSAVGTGGRKLRTGEGVIYDHFNLVYEYPDGLAISFTSRQFGKGPDDIGCWVFGSRGTIDTHYFGDVKIHGDAPYPGGRMGNLFTDGAVNNIATFHKSITEGRCDNPTVAASVRSNLTCVLGRIAAYTGRKVTWAEMMKANEKLEADLKGLKA
jgi:predicted dehydrogenase